MENILKDVDLLSHHCLFQTATFTQVAQIEEAIQRLFRVEPSISDSELDTYAQSNIQSIAEGGHGMQNNNYGPQNANLGPGNQYNISGSGHHHFS